MCFIINYFVTVTVMYYSNLQVNYMVTVLIRYLLSFSLLSCSKCFVCLCLFLFGVQTKVVLATSDLRLFIHIFNLFPSLPTPLPYKSAAAITSLLFTPSVGSPLNQMHRLELTDYLLLQGHWGKEDAANTSAFCLTSMEARWLIRAGGGGGGTKEPKRPERPWTAARTMEVSLVHCATAVSPSSLNG